MLGAPSHRPGQGAQIEYLGETWDVTASSIHNPEVKLRSTGAKKRQDVINWQTAQFRIKRPNTANDFDMRAVEAWPDNPRGKKLSA
jgi:hypothetical protein